jgi:hypothetical protein
MNYLSNIYDFLASYYPSFTILKIISNYGENTPTISAIVHE